MSDVIVRRTSLALRPLDDLTSSLVQSAEARVEPEGVGALRKSDGFYVFSNLSGGLHTVTVEEPSYRAFRTDVTLPLPVANRLLIDVHGENEEFVVISSVDVASRTLTFEGRTIRPALPRGTTVMTSRIVTALSEEAEGDGVISVVVDDVGSGPTLLRTGDFVRLRRDRVIRLRPGPYYAFEQHTKRLTGVVTDVVTMLPIAGAEARVERIDNLPVSSQNVGTTATNRVELFHFNPGTTRIVGTELDVAATTDARGRFALTFSPRANVDPATMRVRFSAPGYLASSSNVSLSPSPAALASVALTPA
jgi:hypothetical protein